MLRRKILKAKIQRHSGRECVGPRVIRVQRSGQVGAGPERPSWVARRQRRRTSQSAPCLSFFPYRNAAMCRFRFVFYGRALQRRAAALSLRQSFGVVSSRLRGERGGAAERPYTGGAPYPTVLPAVVANARLSRPKRRETPL
ncbi:unnamed protein product, partial [Iphiclides podalirius]